MNDRTDVVRAIEAQEVPRGLRLWWLGGPSYALKSPRTLVYVDPYHSGDRAAKQMFAFSILYLFLLFALLIADHPAAVG